MEPSADPDDDGARALLRSLPVLTADPPPFDLTDAPPQPAPLFRAWLDDAIRAGVREPHAVTVSTVGPDGCPDARVLILKAVDHRGWHIAVNAVSAKGRDLAARPLAALTFYWPELMRQVRVRGPVVDDGAMVATADFRARSAGARAMALTRRQSEPLADPAEIDLALDGASLELERDPDLVPAEWVSYAVTPRQVEFWQGDPDRRHRRLRYEATGDTWIRAALWP